MAGFATATSGVVAGVACVLVAPMVISPEPATCVCSAGCASANAITPIVTTALPPITATSLFTALRLSEAFLNVARW